MVSAEVAAAAKKATKPKKALDAGIHKHVLRDIPNSRLYVELRELDLRIEQYTNRKKAEVCDMDQPLDLSTRCLRLYLYNHHTHQGSEDPARPPAWSFYILGQFIESAAAPAMPPALAGTIHDAAAQKKATSERFWTASMASVELRIEEQGQDAPQPEVVLWERNRHVGLHKEAIEFHRTGSRPARITVTMIRDFAPEFLIVSDKLAAAIGMRQGTRGQLLRRLWQYIHAHSAPDAADPSVVTCDSALLTLFGEHRLVLTTVGSRLEPHLSPVEPVVLTYDVQLDGPSPSEAMCYDVEVAWSLKPAMLEVPAFLESLDVKTYCEEHDRRIAECLHLLKQHHRKAQFYCGFGVDPVVFIKQLIAASAKELRENNNNVFKMNTSENFHMPWAQEAAVHYLTKDAMGR